MSVCLGLANKGLPVCQANVLYVAISLVLRKLLNHTTKWIHRWVHLLNYWQEGSGSRAGRSLLGLSRENVRSDAEVMVHSSEEGLKVRPCGHICNFRSTLEAEVIGLQIQGLLELLSKFKASLDNLSQNRKERGLGCVSVAEYLLPCVGPKFNPSIWGH